MNENIEAQFNKLPYYSLGKDEIDNLKEKTKNSPRNRFRICLHNDPIHLTQEMIMCFYGFSYFQPHKHEKHKSESYHMIEGALDLYLLDDNGKIINVIKLASSDNDYNEKRQKIYRLSSPIYHLMIPLTKWTIFHEISTGPYEKNNATYAPFAPTDNAEKDEIKRYLNKLIGNNNFINYV